MKTKKWSLSRIPGSQRLFRSPVWGLVALERPNFASSARVRLIQASSPSVPAIPACPANTHQFEEIQLKSFLYLYFQRGDSSGTSSLDQGQVWDSAWHSSSAQGESRHLQVTPGTLWTIWSHSLMLSQHDTWAQNCAWETHNKHRGRTSFANKGRNKASLWRMWKQLMSKLQEPGTREA